jgi:hypothetical protein
MEADTGHSKNGEIAVSFHRVWTRQVPVAVGTHEAVCGQVRNDAPYVLLWNCRLLFT